MILLQASQLTKSFGAEAILSNIKLEVKTKDRVALVGRNGAGKSTLLKIIAGELSYDSGEIIKPKSVSIGYLSQDTGLESSKSIWDELESVFQHLKAMEKKLRKMEIDMSDPELLENPVKYEKHLQEYDQLQVSFKEQGGFQYEADIRSILHGLQFHDKDYQSPIQLLSGGQKTRLALGKLLLTRPDVLILDEPTNHLDIETLTWLERYLQTYEGAVLVVSHDRYFLDKIATQVYELSRTKIIPFAGNYSNYLRLKADMYEKELKAYEKQQEEISKLKDFIQKNLARASTTKRAQSRRKALEKMELLDRPQGDEKSAHFSFDIDRQSGNDVLKVEHAAIGYGQKPICTDITFQMKRKDSIALIGPNGIGKSTLLKTLIKQIPLLDGEFQFGANVTIGYYDQEQANLRSNKRVLDELWDNYPGLPEKEIRTVLGNFLFSGDDVLKPVSALSGGEKARLALAKLMMEKSNVLILDEPTNHLDLDSKEILENALIDYPGTILFVSHDRYFINRIATKVVELTGDGTKEYLGDYDYYLTKKEELEEVKKLEAQAEIAAQLNTLNTTVRKLSYEEEKEQKRLERQKKRQVEELEMKIERLELEIESIQEELYKPENIEDHQKLLELQTKQEKLHAELDQTVEEWTLLAEEIETAPKS
ncbi:ATP-binding cassette subfamily F protein 3 [Bacillus oleivorans]|uniref:ATP-binding cassette subfamily F protein 3 n=1 Tax=Bacillus oleivorans TaxID=1448271 RepID=A0A285D7K2_9BACI|nr:ABC-F family ATP-binding cassette domain-containing protein [Bacillus oleivorans]SNX75790.1 ATP-binding cassette subfamily F protein 3 [Bacillus oleivorans]